MQTHARTHTYTHAYTHTHTQLHIQVTTCPTRTSLWLVAHNGETGVYTVAMTAEHVIEHNVERGSRTLKGGMSPT